MDGRELAAEFVDTARYMFYERAEDAARVAGGVEPSDVIVS